ncbi:MAG: transcriptional repressor [Elusimicrobiota bacterium]|jgi:Fur family peroxide stress response transcriptional regulator|nr:transcriptional repressor [Elusimicrobiota bacterium]
MNINLKSIVSKLRKAGISPSIVRVQILKYLETNKIHPTVDTIYKKLSSSIPTLSRTSVYNTLNLFAQTNLIKKVYIDDEEMRYDAFVEEHGHFKCSICEKIFDFDVDFSALKISNLENFQITHKDILVFGTCPNCAVKTKKEEVK